MGADLPLALQTVYADLLDRCATATFDAAFAEDGVFTSKAVRGRRYWYFQVARPDGTRQQRYVGPETPELLERIDTHKKMRGDQKERRMLVSTLLRTARLPRPDARIGQIVEALAGTGVFRLRGVLVGTVSYQTYSAMLGFRLPLAAIQTGDVDIAQFRDVSIAVEEAAPAVLDTLKTVDPSFRAVPAVHDGSGATAYVASSGLRVDFLTPNKGPDSDAPVPLPALGTQAQPFRFLDFLIHDPEPAVLLQGEGIYIHVPSPQRFALHKLIVARCRPAGSGKVDKDLRQAESLFDALVRKRPHDLRTSWREAFSRGRKWRKLLGEGLGLIDAHVRDDTLKIVGGTRSFIPGLNLEFSAPRARYDFDRDIIAFIGRAGGGLVRCAVAREALVDHYGADGTDKDSLLQVFRRERADFERLTRRKYLYWPVEEAGNTLIRTEDIGQLREEVSAGP